MRQLDAVRVQAGNAFQRILKQELAFDPLVSELLTVEAGGPDCEVPLEIVGGVPLESSPKGMLKLRSRVIGLLRSRRVLLAVLLLGVTVVVMVITIGIT